MANRTTHVALVLKDCKFILDKRDVEYFNNGERAKPLNCIRVNKFSKRERIKPRRKA